MVSVLTGQCQDCKCKDKDDGDKLEFLGQFVADVCRNWDILDCRMKRRGGGYVMALNKNHTWQQHPFHPLTHPHTHTRLSEQTKV